MTVWEAGAVEVRKSFNVGRMVSCRSTNELPLIRHNNLVCFEIEAQATSQQAGLHGIAAGVMRRHGDFSKF